MSVVADEALFALLRFASPGLPIGAFAYSRGLEFAVHAGWVADEASAAEWVMGLLEYSTANLDGPVFVRLYRAFAAGELAAAEYWNGFLIANRETAELRFEDQQLGAALMRLLAGSLAQAAAWSGRPDVAYVSAFALAMHAHHVPLQAALGALFWAQSEAQTSAALRLVPLGQSAGQRILSRLCAELPRHVQHALQLPDAELGGFAPALALGSALHETQYTRLFRS